MIIPTADEAVGMRFPVAFLKPRQNFTRTKNMWVAFDPP